MTSEIICGDCLEVMRAMPDDSVDLVICSPPYEAARTYSIRFDLRGEDWARWAFSRFIQCLRVSKGLVAWVVEGQTRNYRYSASPILLMANLHRAGVNLRKPPIFHRVGIPGSGGPDWLRNDYEFIICATNEGKLPWSDNTACGHPPKWAPGGEMSHRLTDGTKRNQWGHSGTGTNGHRNADGIRKKSSRPGHVVETVGKVRSRKVITIVRGGMHNQDQSYEPPTLANPGNKIQSVYDAETVGKIVEELTGESGDILSLKVGGGLMGHKLAHENEAPFPLRLAEFFIKSFCPPGGKVLDPFGGSGTVLHAAAIHGRNGIAIDIRDTQCDLMRRRMADVESNLKPTE